MLNIDNALPPGCAPSVPADASTPQPQDGIFSLALEAEYEKMLVSAESQTAAHPALDIIEDLKNVPLPDASAPKVAPEKREAGKSEEDSSLSAISFLGWTQPLWQNLPGSAGEQLPGKENTSPRPLPAAASEVAKAVTGRVVAEANALPPQDGIFSLALKADSSLSAISFPGWKQLPAKETTSPPSLPAAASEAAKVVTERVVAEAMLSLPVPSRVGDAVHELAATTGSPIPEQAAPPDYVVAVNQPVASASLPADLTGGGILKATANASDATQTEPAGEAPEYAPPQQARFIAHEKTQEIVSRAREHATSTAQPDNAGEEQSGSTKALPPSAPDSLRLEAAVSIVHAADNPKAAGSSQPEASLQKQADPAGLNLSVPLASAETAASNGDATEQQSQGSKQNNPEINISRPPAEPEEEQRAVRVIHKPVPETQLPSDPRGPVSSHDTGKILPGGSSKTTEAPSVPQSQVWNQIEESSVISQLVAKARGFQWEKNSEIVISLKPESLGRISLRASIVDQTVVATIVTESDKVKNLLELEMPVLHHALQENGMPVRVVVVQGNDLSFSNTAGNGQSHLHENPLFQKSNGSPNLWAPQLGDRNDAGLNESPEVVDSRYRSRSIHLIA